MKQRTVRLGLFIGLIFLMNSQTAFARPQYYKQFRKLYPKYAPDGKKIICALCHAGRNKRIRNAYGRRLETALGGKHIKDVRRIREALLKIGPPKKPKPELRSLTLPARRLVETSFVSARFVQKDVADVPSSRRTIAANKRMTYFLIPAADKKPPKEGYGLVVLLPGGSGRAAFHPFVKRIRKHAIPSNVIVAQPIAVKWTDKQVIVWPTEKSKVDKQEFSTEAFIDAVIKDVGTVHKIDPKRTWAMGWSSSGPAIYATALRKKTPIAGSYIMMSVYKPKFLPPVKNAKGRRFYIEHSPDDRVCPHWMAKKAYKELKEAGANVEFTEYRGGHGFRGNIYGRMKAAFKWLNTK